MVKWSKSPSWAAFMRVLAADFSATGKGVTDEACVPGEDGT